jgi:DNA-binding transcriptional MerR regulator
MPAMDDELLTIGRFARLAGLSVGALRHYDAQGVLRPAAVDPASGYRRYRRDQVATARAVAAMRGMELSLPAIRALLEAGDETARASILGTERTRLEARTARLQRALHQLSALSSPTAPHATGTTSEETLMPTAHPAPKLTPEVHRQLGAGLFNRTWDLLAIEDRTQDQDDELIDTAHASAWHWRQVGAAANAARGHWLCSRVYAVLGRGEPAVHHARRATEILAVGGSGIEDWDAAAAAEAMSRALAVAGDLTGAETWKAKAVDALDSIADPEDRAVIERDVATLPV